MQPTKGDELIKGDNDLVSGNELSQRGAGASGDAKKRDKKLEIDDSVIKRPDDESEDDEEEEEDAESLKKMFNVEAEDLH